LIIFSEFLLFGHWRENFVEFVSFASLSRSIICGQYVGMAFGCSISHGLCKLGGNNTLFIMLFVLVSANVLGSKTFGVLLVEKLHLKFRKHKTNKRLIKLKNNYYILFFSSKINVIKNMSFKVLILV